MANYPLTTFHFKVDMGGTEIACSDVTGLNFEHEVLEYRDGTDKTYTKLKLPGLKKFPNITLKKGVFKGSKQFYEWLGKTEMDKPQRQAMTIQLLDEKDGVALTWKVTNAWPVKMTSPDLKADAGTVAVEQLEIAHEGFTME